MYHSLPATQSTMAVKQTVSSFPNGTEGSGVASPPPLISVPSLQGQGGNTRPPNSLSLNYEEYGDGSGSTATPVSLGNEPAGYLMNAKMNIPVAQRGASQGMMPSPPSYSPQSDGENFETSNELLKLKRFLLTAPLQFADGDLIHQYRLPNDEQISCVRWKQMFFITGTDIVRCLLYRFEVFGRDIVNRKKFEEGVFSDLRNLKINCDAILENPKSELLEFLYKRDCVRTKKKQKVFFWYSVHHEQLFIDVLERELKREAAFNAFNKSSSKAQHNGSSNTFGLSPGSTIAVREPALSFKYDAAHPLVKQISGLMERYTGPLTSLTANLPSTSECSLAARKQGNNESYQEILGSENNPSSHGVAYSQVKTGNGGYPISPIQSTKGSNPISPEHWELRSVRSQSSCSTPPHPLYGPSPFLSPNVYPYEQYGKDHLKHVSQLPSKGFSGLGPDRQPSSQRWTKNDTTNENKQIYENLITIKPEENTDFPLEVLARESQVFPRSYYENQFDSRYLDFAYKNRPAATYGLKEETVSPPLESAFQMLGSPFEQGSKQNSVSSGYPLPNQINTQTANSWDTYAPTGSLGYSRESSKEVYGGPKYYSTPDSNLVSHNVHLLNSNNVGRVRKITPPTLSERRRSRRGLPDRDQ